jgi:hypothetical protein
MQGVKPVKEKDKHEWSTTELRYVNGTLRWVVINHRVVALAEVLPPWWQRLVHYLTKRLK